MIESLLNSQKSSTAFIAVHDLTNLINIKSFFTVYCYLVLSIPEFQQGRCVLATRFPENPAARLSHMLHYL